MEADRQSGRQNLLGTLAGALGEVQAPLLIPGQSVPPAIIVPPQVPPAMHTSPPAVHYTPPTATAPATNAVPMDGMPLPATVTPLPPFLAHVPPLPPPPAPPPPTRSRSRSPGRAQALTPSMERAQAANMQKRAEEKAIRMQRERDAMEAADAEGRGNRGMGAAPGVQPSQKPRPSTIKPSRAEPEAFPSTVQPRAKARPSTARAHPYDRPTAAPRPSTARARPSTAPEEPRVARARPSTARAHPYSKPTAAPKSDPKQAQNEAASVRLAASLSGGSHKTKIDQTKPDSKAAAAPKSRATPTAADVAAQEKGKAPRGRRPAAGLPVAQVQGKDGKQEIIFQPVTAQAAAPSQQPKQDVAAKEKPQRARSRVVPPSAVGAAPKVATKRSAFAVQPSASGTAVPAGSIGPQDKMPIEVSEKVQKVSHRMGGITDGIPRGRRGARQPSIMEEMRRPSRVRAR